MYKKIYKLDRAIKQHVAAFERWRGQNLIWTVEERVVWPTLMIFQDIYVVNCDFPSWAKLRVDCQVEVGTVAKLNSEKQFYDSLSLSVWHENCLWQQFSETNSSYCSLLSLCSTPLKLKPLIPHDSSFREISHSFPFNGKASFSSFFFRCHKTPSKKHQNENFSSYTLVAVLINVDSAVSSEYCFFLLFPLLTDQMYNEK